MNIKNILVVDDNKDLAQCLSILLSEESYQVTVVYTGEDAIARAQWGRSVQRPAQTQPHYSGHHDDRLPG